MSDASLAQSSPSAEFLSLQNLQRADEAVLEVFARMLGLQIAPTEPQIQEPGPGEDRTAIVGFSGAMRGCCEVQLNEQGAQAVASAMLGTPVDDAASLDDAVGEICNMVGGGWKDRVPSLSSQCALSPPTVISGRAYKVNMSRPSDKITRTYHFDGNLLFLTIRRENMGSD
jgi:chemotaxis protein CheX